MRRQLVSPALLVTTVIASPQDRDANRLTPSIPETDHFTNVQMHNRIYFGHEG
jgi:hypothetical protein